MLDTGPDLIPALVYDNRVRAGARVIRMSWTLQLHRVSGRCSHFKNQRLN